MARFHINPTTGSAGACSAKPGNCPFGADAPHYSSLEDARSAYEASRGPATAVGLKKPRKASHSEYDTVLPEPEYEFIEKTTEIRYLKIGDKIGGRPIKDIVTGRKNATVTVEHTKKTDGSTYSRTIYKPLDEEIEVEAWRETQDSIGARNRASRELTREMLLKTYSSKREEAISDIQASIAKGSRLHSDQVDKLINSEARDAVMENYKKAVEEAKQDATERPYSAAMKAYKSKLEANIVDRASSGRSTTNEAKDLYERAAVAAEADFVKAAESGLARVW